MEKFNRQEQLKQLHAERKRCVNFLFKKKSKFFRKREKNVERRN